MSEDVPPYGSAEHSASQGKGAKRMTEKPSEPTPAGAPQSWGVPEAAAFLKIHPDTCTKRTRAGLIPGCKVGRAYIYDPELLRKMLRDRCAANVRQAPPKNTLAERLAARRIQRRPVRP